MLIASAACTKQERGDVRPEVGGDAERRELVAKDERSFAGASSEQREPAQGAGCHEQIDTLIADHRGADCASYEWKLKPASRRCVTGCDDPARYAEAVQSGRDTCADLCAQLGCGRGAFAPPDDCEVARCFPGLSLCDPSACPDWNSCFLIRTNPPWNCSCVSD